MILKLKADVYVYVRSKELKDAIFAYAESTNQNVYEVIGHVWEKMLESKDYNIQVSRVYDSSLDTGITAYENQNSRKISLTMDQKLATQVQDVFTELQKQNIKGVNWSSWTQEGIKRYLEPILIGKGFLNESSFKDKGRAAKNIRKLRNHIGLTQAEFVTKYLTMEEQPLISTSQYALIERSGKGNVERIVDILSEVLSLDAEAFYDEPEPFLEYINKYVEVEN